MRQFGTLFGATRQAKSVYFTNILYVICNIITLVASMGAVPLLLLLLGGRLLPVITVTEITVLNYCPNYRNRNYFTVFRENYSFLELKNTSCWRTYDSTPNSNYCMPVLKDPTDF